MMLPTKLVLPLYHLTVVLASCVVGGSSEVFSKRQLAADDSDYWQRFLGGISDSLPTSPPKSPFPTAIPTRERTPEPTAAPTKLPSSPVPSPRPTRQPSPPTSTTPSNGLNCESEVSISCVNQDGVSCDEIVPPRWECDMGRKLQSLRFSLEFCSCADSINTQEGFLLDCYDLLPFPSSADNSVRVTCVAVADNALLFSSTIQDGDDVLIAAEVLDGDFLPEETSCSIFTKDGLLIQSFIINTSGNVDLALTNKFASLSLQACDTQDCRMEAKYSFVVSNTGMVPLTVTSLERARNGELENLLPDLESTQLAPGEVGRVGEAETADLCEGEDYFFTVLNYMAVTSNGDGCEGEADYFFPILLGCLVNVQIKCKSEDGTECTELETSAVGSACLMEVTYEYEIENVGAGTMDITLIDRTRNNVTVSLLDFVRVTSLGPGEMTLIVEKETIDLCVEEEVATQLRAEADPPSSVLCTDDSTYTFATRRIQ
ncbi:expressed unknown protein [Seminavis robusta]|uniref:DUF7467 domain-containing protein n=1 Tax=Seminavis robusta TaxID=568900 RepID=A0A9N8E027_9STRA|nr:expressed unknown protein [Seminavis robusta]|eukprot:Sro486_g152540.1 n/a (487) ;mRNA; f:9561-11120